MRIPFCQGGRRAFSKIGAAVFAFILLSFAQHACAGLTIGALDKAYDDLEYLQAKGLLPEAMLATRPFGRKEAARLAAEARQRCYAGVSCSAPVLAAIDRLKKLDTAKDAKSYLKPFGRPYFKTAYSDKDPHFADINNNGDALTSGLNTRAGFTFDAALWDTFFLSLNPEFRHGEDTTRGELPSAYVSIDAGPFELQAGRDSMWWGSGAHGALLMSNNAEPLDMVRVTTNRPVVLPWVLSPLGLLRPTVFMARLEKDRDFPRANLLGMRLDFKPSPSFQFALNRVFMFGGKGTRGLTFSDWVKAFTASDSAEHTSSPTNGNQLASIDASYVYVNKTSFLPFSGVKLYTEWGAEDSSGKTKTPSNRANMYGAYLIEPMFLGNTDFRVEWANTARHDLKTLPWYTHLRYTSGYTYKGRTIGHHMGSDAQDLFMRFQYHAASGTRIGVEADRETSGVHGQKIKRNWFAVDAFSPVAENLTVSGTAGFEKEKGAAGTNAVVLLRFDYLI